MEELNEVGAKRNSAIARLLIKLGDFRGLECDRFLHKDVDSPPNSGSDQAEMVNGRSADVNHVNGRRIQQRLKRGVQVRYAVLTSEAPEIPGVNIHQARYPPAPSALDISQMVIRDSSTSHNSNMHLFLVPSGSLLDFVGQSPLNTPGELGCDLQDFQLVASPWALAAAEREGDCEGAANAVWYRLS